MPAAEKAVGQAQDLPAAEAQAFLEAMELEKDIQRALALPSNGRRAAAPSDPMQLAAARRQVSP